MFLIYGTSSIRIKKYTDHGQCCKNCKAFDMVIEVHQPYFHILFIPWFPIGGKRAVIRCNDCGEPVQKIDMMQQFEKATKTPFYLFSGLILVAVVIVMLTVLHFHDQDERAAFVEHPQVGDIYQVKKDENNTSTYYFLKLSKIKEDTVFAYHSNLIYNGFVSSPDKDDFFVEEELVFTKKELKQMLADDEINDIERK